MSRWIEQYENHAFQAVWKAITVISETIGTHDASVTTEVEEIARLTKVIAYINELLSVSDPELIPEATWNNFHSQANSCLQQIKNYQNNRNISHITAANANLDNLLTYIRPYQVATGAAAQSAQAAFISYSNTIHSKLSSFLNSADSELEEIEKLKDQAQKSTRASTDASRQIQELEKSYFDDSGSEGVKTKITNLESQLEDHLEKITNYRDKLFGGANTTELSISEEIASSYAVAKSNTDAITSLLSEVETKLVEYKNYHKMVFGIRNEDGEFEGGLRSEISARQQQLDDFKLQQEKKYFALNKEIESLLPGATSAGLAAAYYELKKSFSEPIKAYSNLFYGSVVCLMFVAVFTIVQEVGWFYIKFIEVTNLQLQFSNIIFKLPLVLPVLWLAIFASKRRSEVARLQQEYAHKEAAAKSYQNFKMQIDALNQEAPELLTKLLATTIDVIAKNASDTLDKKHGDNTPVAEGFDKVLENIEKIKKLGIKTG